MPAWFEDEAFWMALYPYLFPEEQFALAEEHVSGYELKERLEQAGFGTVRLFGDLQGNAYGPEASRLIAMAWKAP
jgi:hypothetical protein